MTEKSNEETLIERLNGYAAKPSSRRSVDDGDDLMREAAARIEELEAENFQLAAGVCRWVTGNEHGNAYCGDTGKLL